MSNPKFYTDKPEPKTEISRIGNGVETKMSNGTEIMVDVILCGGKSQAKKCPNFGGVYICSIKIITFYHFLARYISFMEIPVAI